MHRFSNIAVARGDFRTSAIREPVPFWVLFAACGLGCAMLILKPMVVLGVAAAIVGACAMVYLSAAIFSGKVEPLVLLWVLIFPLGYYFFSFPRDKSIITYDRVLVMALVLAIGFISRDKLPLVPRDLRHCAIAWMAFLVVATLSVTQAKNLFTTGRLLVDGFYLPTILGWVVVRYFRVEQNAAKLHLFVSIMAIYVACIGLAEMVLKQDLLPLPGAAIGFAGTLPRPNGPFDSDDEFALIGVLTFFLLLFLRNLLAGKLTFRRRVLHYLGVTASLATALMPMFRSVGISLMVVLLIASLSARKPSRRFAGFTLLGCCVLVVLLASVLAPDTYADRSDPGNVYGRLAEQRQTWRLFCSHPIVGVGLGQFADVVARDTRYLELYGNVRSVDSPHNTLGGVLAETGVLGFVPYVTAQITLFLVFWHLRKQPRRNAQLAWTYFLYIFLGYWINGMSLTVGYSSNTNLWFIFSIAVLYKYAMTEKLEPVGTGPTSVYSGVR